MLSEDMRSDHLIGGEWVPSQSGRTAESVDPSNGRVLGRFADGGKAEAAAAIAGARSAFFNPAWSQNPRLRQDVMLAWAVRLDAKRDELARLLTLENGKAIGQARGEMMGAISEIRYYAGLTRHIPGHVLEVEPGIFSTMIREPAGVTGIIVPWNAPAVLLVRSLAPALAAGCTAVIKPAPQTTIFTAAMLRELGEVAALPNGVVNLVGETGHAIAEMLAASPQVDVLSFTGSTATGKKIMIAAAETMKKLSLELGGKSCCLVFPDADIAAVAPKLAAAATIISGQQCTAARRVLVHASRFQEMKEHLRAALSRIVIGPGLDPKTEMGPLIDVTTCDQIDRRIADAFDACDEVVLCGGRPGSGLEKGAFLTCSLVAHSDPNAFFCQ